MGMNHRITFEAAKEAYIRQYGNARYDKDRYESFDEAFKETWDNYTYISEDRYLYDFVEGMSQMPQLSHN
jgi:hypothetical protein